MRGWIIGSLALLAGASMAQANLLTNGDFSGGLTGWSTFYGDTGTTPVGANESQASLDSVNGNPASSARLDRVSTAAADNKDFLYQFIPVTPGTVYSFDAQWKGDLIAGGNNRNWSEVYVAFFPTGTVITDATQLPDADIVYKKRWDPTSGTLNVDQATGAWDWESVLTSPNSAASPADGTFTATDALMLVGFNIGGRAGSGVANFNVDNVTVTAAATPEPASLTIVGAMSSLLLLRRRHRSA